MLVFLAVSCVFSTVMLAFLCDSFLRVFDCYVGISGCFLRVFDCYFGISVLYKMCLACR